MKQVRHLRALQAFEVAASHQNLSRAAEALGVTQGAVSHQIAQLENYLGVALFRRVSNGVKLTEFGLRLHAKTGQAFASLEMGIDEIRRSDNKKSLTISLPVALATKWLVTRLPRFRSKHPSIELFLDTSDEIVDFASSEIDVALRFSNKQIDGLFYEQIFNESLVTVASPRLVQGLNRPFNAKLISTLPILDDVFDPGWKEWGLLFDPSGHLKVVPSIRFKDSAVMISAAIDGQGVALARRILVADDIASGRLLRLDDKEISLDRSLSFVCRSRDKNLHNIRILRKWLQTL